MSWWRGRFGYLPDEAAKIIRRQAGPIRLLESDLRHIEERHGDQIRQAGYPTVETFVRSIAEDYNRIYAVDSGSMAILVHRIGRQRFAIIRLQPSTEQGGLDFYAVKTASLCRPEYLLNRSPLLEQDGPILSLVRDPFNPGTEADVNILGGNDPPVKGLQTHPPPSAILSGRLSPFDTLQENQTMAAQLDHLFSYGPLDVIATYDEKSPGLHITHEDAENSAFIPSGDPVHKEILTLIEKNPRSLGFVANQIQARLEQEGRWAGPTLDDEGISLGPPQEVAREDPAPERAPEESLEKAPLAVGPVMPMKAGVSVVKAQEQPEPENEPAKEQGLSTGSPESQEKAAQSPDLPVPDPLDAQQPETSPKVAEPAKEEDLTKDWQGNPANDAQAPEQKAPEQSVPEPEPARVFPKKVPPEILMADAKRGKPLVLDHGDKVSVTNRAMLGIGREAEDRRNKSVEVALKAAKERFGEPVRFSGSRAFEEKTIEMAVRMGIQLEPATEHGKRAYEKALEAKNALGPSQNRAPSKQKAVEKGIGL